MGLVDLLAREEAVIIARFVNKCWKIFLWSLLTLSIVGVLLAQYFYARVDNEIRARVEKMLAEAHPNLQVQVRAARLLEGQGIEIRGVSISDPTLPHPYQEMILVEEMFLQCGTELKLLLSGQLNISQVTLRGPVIRLVHLPDGRWSTDRLFPLPKMGQSKMQARGRIEQGVLEIIEPQLNTPAKFVLHDVAMDLEPQIDPATAAPYLTVSGTMKSDFLPQIEVAGSVDVSHNRWIWTGKAVALEISPELLASLPEPLQTQLAAARGIRARTDVSYRIERLEDGPQALRFQVDGHLYRGRIDDPRSPFPITDLNAQFTATHDGVTLKHLHARSGESTFALHGWWQGYTAAGPGSFHGEVQGLPLDYRLYQRLPESAQKIWDDYSPRGKCDLNFDVVHGPQGWQPTGSCDLHDASFSFHKFPYRVENISGRMFLREKTLWLDLHTQTGERPLIGKGFIKNPGPEAEIELKIQGQQIAVEERLLRAIPQPTDDVLRSMHLQGSFDLQLDIRRAAGLGQSVDQQVQIQFQQASLNYDKFPLPLQNVRGTVHGLGRVWMRDGQTLGKVWNWDFRDMQASKGAGRIQGEGSIQPSKEGNRLALHLKGTNFSLDDELQASLPPAQQQLWQKVNPQGFIDLDCHVDYLAGAKPNIRVDIIPLGAVIEPSFFPYRFEKLQGMVRIDQGRLLLQNMRAQHGNVLIGTNGECEVSPDGGWKVKFSDLNIDRVQLERDRDLVQALPEKLRTTINTLRLSGPMSMKGTLELSKTMPRDIVDSAWQLTLFCQRCEMEGGLKLSNIYGSMSLAGRYDEQGLRARGELDFETAEYKDFQFTQVRGPLWMNEKRVVLGARDAFERQTAAESTPADNRHLTAKVCGGTIVGDTLIALGPQPEYHLQARLVDGDLERYAKEMMPGKQQHLSGRILGALELHGAGSQTLRGEGRIALREADIYEIPVMVSLLSILSLKTPDNTAFSESDVEFRIVGNYIQFKKLDFRGDAISLRGTGSMNTNSELQLSFHAIVGRDDLRLPLVEKMIGRASQQLMEIQVTGTLQNPKTTRKLIPGVQHMLNGLNMPLPSPNNGLPPQPTIKP